VQFCLKHARENDKKRRGKGGKKKEKERKEAQNVKKFLASLAGSLLAAQVPRGYRSDTAEAFGLLKPWRLSPSCCFILAMPLSLLPWMDYFMKA